MKSPTRCNTSSNTAAHPRRKLYWQVLKFLEQTRDGRTDWSPKDIADELKANYSSVRFECRELFRHNMVVAIPKGKFTEYRASKIAHDDISRLKNAYPTTGERPKFHGLTLKLTADKLGKTTFDKAITNTIPLGGVVRAKMRGVAGVGTRETSFQLSKACLMIYCSCTNMPMDYDDFVTWLARVDGFLESKGWPRLMHNLELWVSRQFGFSKDYKLREANGLVRSVSLKGMWEWYAEVYEKKMPNGETVLRAGVHSTEEQTMASIVGMMSGDISRVYAEDLLRQTTEAQNINFAINVGTARHVFEDLVQYGSAHHPFLGVGATDVTARVLRTGTGDLKPLGAFINYADATGPAGRAGLRQNDIITQLGNETVQSAASLVKALWRHEVGDVVEVAFWRDGKELKTNVTLGDRTPNSPLL